MAKKEVAKESNKTIETPTQGRLISALAASVKAILLVHAATEMLNTPMLYTATTNTGNVSSTLARPGCLMLPTDVDLLGTADSSNGYFTMPKSPRQRDNYKLHSLLMALQQQNGQWRSTDPIQDPHLNYKEFPTRVVNHKCFNKWCFNPYHVEFSSQSYNASYKPDAYYAPETDYFKPRNVQGEQLNEELYDLGIKAVKDKASAKGAYYMVEACYGMCVWYQTSYDKDGADFIAKVKEAIVQSGFDMSATTLNRLNSRVGYLQFTFIELWWLYYYMYACHELYSNFDIESSEYSYLDFVDFTYLHGQESDGGTTIWGYTPSATLDVAIAHRKLTHLDILKALSRTK